MSSLEWTTLGVAMLGAVTGVLALATQIWGLLLPGPRVRVSIASAFSTGGGPWFLSLDASNLGRLPVTILDMGVAFKAKGKMQRAPAAAMPAGTWNGPQAPYRLIDAEAVTWLLHPQPIARTLAELGETDVRGYVRLATGREVRSRKKMDIVKLARMR